MIPPPQLQNLNDLHERVSLYLTHSLKLVIISGQDTGQDQRSSHATHPLMLVEVCAKYGNNPSRTVGAVEHDKMSRIWKFYWKVVAKWPWRYRSRSHVIMHDTTFRHSWKWWERFNAIYIQENWQGRTSDFSLVQIDGFNCFYCDKRSE